MTTAHGLQSIAWLLVVVPAVSAAILLLGGKYVNRWGHWLGALVPAALFVYSVALFFSVKAESNHEVSLQLYKWIPVGSFQINVGFLINPLSLVFVLLITGVGGLIHIYSLGYMEHDEGRRRFFGQFNLFIAAMLLLVLADNYLVLYVGWEGVGLASYLLIGFYYNRPTAATAAKKAFIANRVGDVGLSIGIMIMFAYFGTTSFAGVFASMTGASTCVATALGFMLLLGACGKSGQFPLQTWSPDAMEGPTPVSALIHAATMVTAGVYLIARSSVIYLHAPMAMELVACVGLLTAVFAATIGLAQNDIKKVFAYSTVSQLGYMFLGLGVGAFSAGIFHLITHTFFKALLFLGAGSVIHALEGEQDMRNMGGLWNKIPRTFATLLCAAVAIGGLPLFFGLRTMVVCPLAADAQCPWMYWVGVTTAGMTAFYVFRAVFMTFFGR